jgi:membrane protein DedA with SNARE-associated domain
MNVKSAVTTAATVLAVIFVARMIPGVRDIVDTALRG